MFNIFKNLMRTIFLLFILLLLLGCEKERLSSYQRQKPLKLETIQVDSLSNESLMKFIEVEVDTFDNDTTYSFQCPSEFEMIDPLYTSMFLLSGNSLHIRFLIPKSIYDDYVTAEFRCDDGKINREIFQTKVYSGTGQTYLYWSIYNKGDYSLLKEIANSNKVIARFDNDPATDTSLGKDLCQAINIFIRFIEGRGFKIV